MSRHPIPALFTTCLVTLTAAATPPRVSEVPELKGLAERWTEAIGTMGVPGFSVAVVKDGKVLAVDAFGVRDVDNHPVSPRTMFYIASATKPFTAMGVCRLADEGKLDLDQPVATYLPSFRLADANAAKSITVRDLLCHKIGLQSGAIVHRDAYTGEIDDDTYFRLLAKVTPRNEMTYSNIHFTLAGRVIEAVTGKKWQDYLAESIFKPAGMPRTTAYASAMYGDPDCAMPMIPMARDSEGRRLPSPLLKTDRTMHAAGGTGTCAEDAARWLLLNLNGGAIDGTRIISEQMAAQMLSPQSTAAQPRGRIRIDEGFGLGWGRGKYRDREPYFSHGGGYVGAASYFCFLPKENIGVAVLVNCDGPGAGMTDIVSIDILDRLLGITGSADLLPQYIEMVDEMRGNADFTRPTAANTAKTPNGLTLPTSACLGTFENDDYGRIAVETDDAGALWLESGDLRGEPLAAGATDAFRLFIAPGMAMNGRFVLSEDRRSVIAIAINFDDDVETRFDRTANR